MYKSASVSAGLALACTLSAGFLSAQTPAAAQTPAGPTPAQVHLGHVTTKFVNVREGGLMQAARAEANVVVQHAALGMQNPNDLNSMKTHARHIIHAIDPRRVESGPGTGYGLLQASENLVRHVELASRAAGANDQMKTHATHVVASAKNTQRRADRIVAMAIIIADFVETPADAAELFRDLKALADQLVAGTDANGDGTVGWQEGEGGLQIVEQHVGFMTQALR
jgi:hypothetical protein